MCRNRGGVYMKPGEVPVQDIADCAWHGSGDTRMHNGDPFPREVLTLGLVSACVSFWALVFLAVKTI
jgi:hypothetical protein